MEKTKRSFKCFRYWLAQRKKRRHKLMRSMELMDDQGKSYKMITPDTPIHFISVSKPISKGHKLLKNKSGEAFAYTDLDEAINMTKLHSSKSRIFRVYNIITVPLWEVEQRHVPTTLRYRELKQKEEHEKTNQ